MNPRGYLINGNFYDENISDSKLDLVTPLYTENPIAKELTDEEIWGIASEYFVGKSEFVYEFARAILRKASEK